MIFKKQHCRVTLKKLVDYVQYMSPSNHIFGCVVVNSSLFGLLPFYFHLICTNRHYECISLHYYYVDLSYDRRLPAGEKHQASRRLSMAPGAFKVIAALCTLDVPIERSFLLCKKQI